MGGLGTAATTLITTKGLFIGDGITSALEFGAGITPFFRLWISSYTPPMVAAGSNGGSRPLAPGEIADLFQEIDPATGMRKGGPSPSPFQPIDPATGKRVSGEGDYENWYVVPLDKEAQMFGESGGKLVGIKFTFAGKEHERLYRISDKRAKSLIEVINFVNATRDQISVGVSGVKRVTTKTIVEIRNLVLRRNRNKY